MTDRLAALPYITPATANATPATIRTHTYAFPAIRTPRGAGPIPHLPADGKVVTFSPKSPTATEVAHGAPLLVDVEFGRGRALFALSQDVGSGGPPATPALPNTGALVRVNRDGTLTVITGGLDRPTSLKFIGSTAYIVTLTGEVWTIDDVGFQSSEEEDR